MPTILTIKLPIVSSWPLTTISVWDLKILYILSLIIWTVRFPDHFMPHCTNWTHIVSDSLLRLWSHEIQQIISTQPFNFKLDFNTLGNNTIGNIELEYYIVNGKTIPMYTLKALDTIGYFSKLLLANKKLTW